MSKKEIILIFILLIISLVRFFFFTPSKPNYTEVVGKEVVFEGKVIDTPDIRNYNQRIVIKPNKEDTNILVVAPKEINIFYGDQVIVYGVLENPENFITDTGKEFNYDRYLSNKDIYFLIKEARVEIISHNNKTSVKGLLFRLRDLFMKNIEMVISSPKSDLANGLILGARGGFDNETKNEFINTGTIHIVALSGYNITIVAEGVMRVFGLVLTETLSIFLGIFIIILFILMTGGTSTAIRAGIMAFIMLFGRMTGRNYDAGRALIIAGFLMIAYDLRVITDISFQLSFLATGGVLFITPKIIDKLRFLTIRFKFRELVATTISATMAVLPVLLYSTGIFSLVSLPVNILILPFIPVAMFLSFVVGVVGFISPSLSLPFAFVSDLLLSYILLVIHFFASLSFASVNIKSFPLIVTILLYIILLLWVFKKKIHQSTV
jgi:competence protein ComEC